MKYSVANSLAHLVGELRSSVHFKTFDDDESIFKLRTTTKKLMLFIPLSSKMVVTRKLDEIRLVFLIITLE